MKLLLITLSILLTSSPLFGQETGVLYLWENGTKYMGEWKDGKRHGQGNMTYHDGSKFVGKWKNGKRHGQGTYTWCFYCSWCSSLPGATNSSHPSSFADGRKYEGEFKDGKKHGQGTYTNKVGEKYVGEYKDGRRWNGIMYDKYGKIEFKLVNGKRIKQ
jgi:hypothetical protein